MVCSVKEGFTEEVAIGLDGVWWVRLLQAKAGGARASTLDHPRGLVNKTFSVALVPHCIGIPE